MTLQRVKSVCTLSIESFSKNKLVTVEIYLGSFNLVIFVSFNEKKLTRFDKKLKQLLFLFNTQSKKINFVLIPIMFILLKS